MNIIIKKYEQIFYNVYVQLKEKSFLLDQIKAAKKLKYVIMNIIHFSRNCCLGDRFCLTIFIKTHRNEIIKMFIIKK